MSDDIPFFVERNGQTMPVNELGTRPKIDQYSSKTPKKDPRAVSISSNNHHSKKKPTKKSSSRRNKKNQSSLYRSFKRALGLTAATTALVGGLVLNSMYRPFADPATMTESQLNAIPSSTRFEMRDLAGQSNLASRKTLSVDDYLFDRTVEVFDTMSYEQIVKTANLHGLYMDFSGLSLKGQDNVDFKKGFEFMWDRKLRKDKDGSLDDFANDSLPTYHELFSRKSNLKKLSRSLEHKIDDYKFAFDMDAFCTKPNGEHIHPEKERMMRNFFKHLDSDIMISYSMTELFPDINPKLNEIIYDKLLEEAGLDFLYFGTVASGDTLLSFGPSQLTPYVVNQRGVSSLNKYISPEFQVPSSMDELNTREEYDRASFFNLVYNIKGLSGRLFLENTLTNFNNLFEKLDDNEQDLLVTGILTAMNYKPALVSKGIANYTDESLAGRVTEKGIVNGLWVGDAQGYYDRSVKNYLTLTHDD